MTWQERFAGYLGIDLADWPLCCDEAMDYLWMFDAMNCQTCGYTLSAQDLLRMIELDYPDVTA